VGADKRLGSESISSGEVPVLAAATDFATRGLGVKDVRASYPEMRKLFEDAAKLFSSIGKKGLADERHMIIEQVPFIFFAHLLYISFHLQVLPWVLTAASIKMGRPHIARREIECAELRLGKDGWPEYYDRKSGWLPGSALKENLLDLDHVNFFDEIIYEGPDTPNDDNNLNAQLHNEGSNSSQPSCPTIDFIEDDLGHPQCSNGSASENEMAATSESDFALFEGDVADISDKEHVQNVVNQPLRRSEREHRRMILESVEHGPLIWPTIEENGATNIILQGLPADIYSLVNHHRVAKDLWERVQLLMQGTSLTKQERECKLYDAFDKFTHIKGESLHKYYLRFTQLINDMNIYNMKMEQFQVNTKFLNSLPPEWSKFVTDVKLVKDLHTTNFDQLHAYLEQHELHANEVRLLRERNQDPLAFVANQQMTPPHFNTYQSSYNNPQLQ
ncbi:integrase, catalytic region, zinc finger, CCHC-type containing protein, partial [Tanacetum coccineum]